MSSTIEAVSKAFSNNSSQDKSFLCCTESKTFLRSIDKAPFQTLHFFFLLFWLITGLIASREESWSYGYNR